MALSLDKFVASLAEASLVSVQDLSAAQSDAPPADAEQLARRLVKQKLLTAYQAQQAYAGKARALVLGNYVVLDKLGQGGMGMVLKARHRRMNRLVALKVLSPAVVKTPEALARFQREVQAAARLEHPNIVIAYDADEANGTHFFVMQYVEGSDLASVVKTKGALPIEQAIQCVMQAAKGLEFAHRNGVIHRDIKPANLLLDAEGTVRILDMGLARIEGDTGVHAELTNTGAVMGTVDYMAPEQALNTKSADARSDLYSLGITLWFLLTGRAAYLGDSLMARLLAHANEPIPSLKALRADVSDGLEAVFRRMVAKKPEDRYQSMTEVLAALTACQRSASAPAAMPGVSDGPSEESRFNQIFGAVHEDTSPGGQSQTRAGRKTRASKSGTRTTTPAAEATLSATRSDVSTDPVTLTGVAKSLQQQTDPPWWTDRRWQAGAAAIVVGLLAFFLPRVREPSAKPTATPPASTVAASAAVLSVSTSTPPGAAVAVTTPKTAVRIPLDTLPYQNYQGHNTPIRTGEDDRFDKVMRENYAQVALPKVRGVMFHASADFGGTAKLTYQLKGEYADIAGTAFCREVRSNPIFAEIQGDGKTLWKSVDLCQVRTAGAPFKVDLRGVYELTLVITRDEPNFASLVLWGNTTLARVDGRPAPVIPVQIPLESLVPQSFDGYSTPIRQSVDEQFNHNLRSNFAQLSLPRARGVMMHASEGAARGLARLTYELKREYAGVEGTAYCREARANPIYAEIQGDGKTLWKSVDLCRVRVKGGPFQVDLRGVNELALVVTRDDPNFAAQILWGDVTLTRIDGGPGPAPPPPPRLAPPSVEKVPLAAQLSSTDFEWSEPINLGPKVNSAEDEMNPRLSSDGLRLWYRGQRGIQISRRTALAAEWEAPVPADLPPIKMSLADLFVSGDEKTLMFASWGKDAPVSPRWMERGAGPNSWTAPVALQAATSLGGFPVLTPDRRTLFFSNYNLRPTSGGDDVCVMTRTGDGVPWMGAASLGPLVNSAASDRPSWISDDGCVLLFHTSRNEKGSENPSKYRVYWTHRSSPDHAWTQAVPLGLPTLPEESQSGAILSPDGSTAYFESARPQGLGKHDLWMSRWVKKGAASSTPDRSKTVDLLKNNEALSDGVLKLGRGIDQDGGSPVFFRGNEPGDEYILEFDLQREGRSGATEVVLLVGGRPCCASLHGSQQGGMRAKSRTGLAMLDGRNSQSEQNPTSTAEAFVPEGKPFHVVCRVTPRHVKVTVDGKTAIDWTGDAKQLSPPPNLRMSSDSQGPALGLVQFKGTLTCQRATLKRGPVDFESKGPPAGGIKQ